MGMRTPCIDKNAVLYGMGTLCTDKKALLHGHGDTSCLSRDRSRRKKNQEKDAQPEKIKRKIDFSDLRNPQKHFTPLFGCLGHSQKKQNNRVATATKLSVACPKTPRKVRVLGLGTCARSNNKEED